MKLFNKFSGQHDDFVHDVAYDYYGKRIATCSSDHKVKIWSPTSYGEWVCEAELEGHKGAVWKLAWAHPEYGQVLASCSFDQQVLIWEEQDAPLSQHNGTEDPILSRQGRWHQTARLKDGRESVSDIKFAPRHLGLRLATCSTDGYVRIFVAEDVMNLEHWTMSEKFAAGKPKEEATCISWNTSRFDPPMLVVGSGQSSKVWVKNENLRTWQVLVELSKHNGTVNDVCWAPNLGRSYHLIATASSDTKIKIWKLRKNESGEYSAECNAELPQGTEVWRCEWNITGTVLASSGDDGTVRLWRQNFQNNRWTCITEVCGQVEG